MSVASSFIAFPSLLKTAVVFRGYVQALPTFNTKIMKSLELDNQNTFMQILKSCLLIYTTSDHEELNLYS